MCSHHKHASVMAFLLLLVICAVPTLGSEAKTDKAVEKPISYYQQIRPLFQAKCHGCHQPAKAKGDYVAPTEL